MILPWAHRLISAGAHGLRRIPGQSVNLAHLIWRTPRAPAPLPSGNKVHPRWFSARGYGCWGVKSLSQHGYGVHGSDSLFWQIMIQGLFWQG